MIEGLANNIVCEEKQNCYKQKCSPNGEHFQIATIFVLIPVRQELAFLVREGSAEDHDEVDECADSKESACEEIEDACANFTDIETMNTESAEEEAKEGCYES